MCVHVRTCASACAHMCVRIWAGPSAHDLTVSLGTLDAGGVTPMYSRHDHKLYCLYREPVTAAISRLSRDTSVITAPCGGTVTAE